MTMQILNWMSDHWLFVIVLALILSGTFTIPKMVLGFLVAVNSR